MLLYYHISFSPVEKFGSVSPEAGNSHHGYYPHKEGGDRYRYRFGYGIYLGFNRLPVS
jgi:hypothetical protein